MKHSKHVFSVLIIIVICIVALFLSGVIRDAKKGSGTVAENGTQNVTYQHGDGSFAFVFPTDFTFTALPDSGDNTETVMFKGNSEKRSFQMYISPWDISDSVTLPKIKTDLPELDIKEPLEISIDGARGVIFMSEEKGTGLVTREIWFSHGERFFQISTYKEFDDTMVDILSTWKWQ